LDAAACLIQNFGKLKGQGNRCISYDQVMALSGLNYALRGIFYCEREWFSLPIFGKK
jgi:hypothetical protein